MKYTIKAFIKEKNETVSSVAQKLHLSRPTFDTYILIYEEGKRLPKKIIKKYLIVCFLIMESLVVYLKNVWICVVFFWRNPIQKIHCLFFPKRRISYHC